MNAKELFDKLGYVKSETNIHITYDSKYEEDYVEFNLLTESYNCGHYNVTMELHKAINKQLEELGWLE